MCCGVIHNKWFSSLSAKMTITVEQEYAKSCLSQGIEKNELGA